jgi:hypothetical protein
MKSAFLRSRARGRASTQDWDAQWSSPSTSLDQLAPLLAIVLAALIALL